MFFPSSSMANHYTHFTTKKQFDWSSGRHSFIKEFVLNGERTKYYSVTCNIFFINETF